VFRAARKAHCKAQTDTTTESKLDTWCKVSGTWAIRAYEAEQVRARAWSASISTRRYASADIRLPLELVIRIERELAEPIHATAKASRADSSADIPTEAEVIAERERDPGSRLQRRRITTKDIQPNRWHVRYSHSNLLLLSLQFARRDCGR